MSIYTGVDVLLGMKRLFILLLLLPVALVANARTVDFKSPDGLYVMTVSDEGGDITFRLLWNGFEYIGKSALGVDMGRGRQHGLCIADVADRGLTDTSWRPVYGERSIISDKYNSYVLNLKYSDSGKPSPYDIEVRMYDEGMAFRYLFTGGSYLKIVDEYTEFAVPDGTMAYFTPRAQTPYSLLPLKDWPGDGQSDRPLLLRIPDHGFMCLGEAQVVDYVRTKFCLSDKPNTIATAMYGPVEEIAPYQSPWRLAMCADNAGDILQHNYIYYNLNPECRIKDPSWIRPGKVMREVTLTTKGAKALVDFAVKRNLQYIHFDAGWYGFEYDKASDATTVTPDPRRNPDPNSLDLQEAVAYARSKGIGVIVYVNQRALQQQLDEILPLYKKWGIAGIKFGFVQVGSQVWTKWMHEAVEKCAQYGLMVDIHDEYRPTGFSRTYPNLMTQEGVRGNEEFPDAFNNTMLPFTRYVCGPADYTICYYRQDFGRFEAQSDDYGVPRSKTIQTTPAHQLALSVVYYSPLQYMYWYDKPSDSRDEPELKFFDDVYTVWDDTRVMEGEPGEYVTIARRHGDEWFVGSIANAARHAEISLDFLPEGKYVAEIYTDGDSSIPTRTKVNVSKADVTAKTVLKFDIRKSGGVAIRIVEDEGEYTAFHPGSKWLDNNGVHINAHGGGILLHKNVYYWFGEHKIEGRAGNQAHVGVHCYSSRDLYNWKDEGVALAVSQDPESDIVEGCTLERPKVIYNKKTKKFVMWFHLEPKGKGYSGAMVGIAQADKVTGPYTFIRSTRCDVETWPVNVLPLHKEPVAEQYRPERANLSKGEHPDSVNTLGRDFVAGQQSRDMTLFVDDDGKAYHVRSSESNSVIHISELTDDYLDFSGRYARAFVGCKLEAPALFKKDGLYYIMGSECTGWRPNPGHTGVAPSIWGPWTELGNPCLDEDAETTYHSQSTFFIPVPGKKGEFIYMGDRWKPENAIDGRYIWLPVEWQDGRPVLHWYDQWDLSIFDK